MFPRWLLSNKDAPESKMSLFMLFMSEVN
jgi:hypothetical protein